MRKLLIYFTIIFLLTSTLPATAQNETQYPVYIVQKGDTLTQIAQKFGIPLSLLLKANSSIDPNNLVIGAKINIPGMEGVTGILKSTSVPFGSNLEITSAVYSIPQNLLSQINRITSPEEVFTGSSLIIPTSSSQMSYSHSGSILAGESLLERALVTLRNPWEIEASGNVMHPSIVIPGDPLFVRSNTGDVPQNRISQLIQSISISPLPLVQGATITIKVKSNLPISVIGKLAGYPLNFFQSVGNEYIALQGIHAMASPGIAKFSLKVSDQAGRQSSIEESILLRSGNFTKDPPLTVDPKTIDPENTRPEDEIVAGATSMATSQKLWSKIFRKPVDDPVCIKSWYGNRRSYNGSPYTYFHTGLDYGVCANLKVFAPAPGIVVFAGPLVVRGNATIIDHGWGVFSGFWHQKTINVKVGDRVAAGQIIGEIGGTGRVTGPHLHWEVWVNGVQVEPQDWLENVYPQ